LGMRKAKIKVVMSRCSVKCVPLHNLVYCNMYKTVFQNVIVVTRNPTIQPSGFLESIYRINKMVAMKTMYQ